MTRVLLVHERLTEMGGSEKVVDGFARLWPESRLFVPIADHRVATTAISELSITVSPLQRLYRGGGGYAHLLPLLPLAMRHADLGDADLIVISHHAFANRIAAPQDTPTLSYVHSPARWMWDRELRSLEFGPRLTTQALSLFARSQLRADRRAAQRITCLVANSQTVAERIERWWDRPATVVHPPVDVTYFTPDASVPREDFFLLAGRLVPYKRPEVAIEAATKAGVRLIVAGQGRSEPACRAVGGPNVTFLGEVCDDTLRDLFRRCRGLVFPGVEDFGIVPVEAQACGAPVIGVDRGGLRETVRDGVSGVLVPYVKDAPGQVAMLADALRNFASSGFEVAPVRANAERFGADVFDKKIESMANDLLSQR